MYFQGVILFIINLIAVRLGDTVFGYVIAKSLEIEAGGER